MANNYQNFQFSPQNQQYTQQLGSQQNNTANQFNPLYPGQIVFPQPIGNVYNLNSAAEVGNIPIGGNVSMGLCLSENIVYIKSLQNGNPMLLGYKLSPLDTPVQTQFSEPQGSKIDNLINALEEHTQKIDSIEKQIIKIKDKIGGKIEWQI